MLVRTARTRTRRVEAVGVVEVEAVVEVVAAGAAGVVVAAGAGRRLDAPADRICTSLNCTPQRRAGSGPYRSTLPSAGSVTSSLSHTPHCPQT